MESVATVCKARLSIADIDRNYYKSHQITLAQQPSETVHKTMALLVAYIYNANDRLTLGQKQSSNKQPELWEPSLQNEIKLWIDLGQPDSKRIKRACNRAKNVIIYSYNQSHTSSWWHKNKDKLCRYQNLEVFSIDANELEKLNNRRMKLNCTLHDGELHINDGENNVVIERRQLM